MQLFILICERKIIKFKKKKTQKLKGINNFFFAILYTITTTKTFLINHLKLIETKAIITN